jgi:hypothetical protein
MRNTGLKSVFLFFAVIPVFLSANVAFLFLFNSNLLLQKDTCLCFNDNIELPIEYFSDASLVFIFDIEGEKQFFLGPTGHDYAKESFSFSFREDVFDSLGSLKFSDYSLSSPLPFQNLETVSAFSQIFKFKELNAVIRAFEDFPDTSFIYNANYSLLSDFIFVQNAKESKLFQEAVNRSEKIFNLFSSDESALKLYLYSLMDMADFYTANSILDRFYQKRDKNETFFSLKANLYAIWGKFDTSLKYIDEGRFLYPESRILLSDAINIYSVVDTAKMLELLDYYQNNK